jgi:hypothetical protein
MEVFVDMISRDRIPANQCLPKVLDPSMPDKFTLSCIHLAESPFLEPSLFHFSSLHIHPIP